MGAVITRQQLRYLAENGKAGGQDQGTGRAVAAGYVAGTVTRQCIKKQGALHTRTRHAGSAP